MGAWDAGTFENDNALDWVDELLDGAPFSKVQQTLTDAVSPPKPKRRSFLARVLGRPETEACLDSSLACEALAAAELVACSLGRPRSDLPEGAADWVRDHSSEFVPEIVDLARRAVAAVRSKSELKDLWEEGDAGVVGKWRRCMDDLDQRLRG